VTLDPSGAVLGDVIVHLTNQYGSEQSIISDQEGRFGFVLLRSGKYELQADKPDFKPLVLPNVQVYVTETSRVELRLELATRVEQTDVSSAPFMVQLDSSALGRTLNKLMVNDLPLVTRNFTQITGLSPGVSVSVSTPASWGMEEQYFSQLESQRTGFTSTEPALMTTIGNSMALVSAMFKARAQ
jgi:hypothetical protein